MRAVKRIDTDKLICFMISLGAVALTFGIFFAQSFFSDVVTFAKSGDAGRQTLPAFIQLGQLIGGHVREGVDVLVANGSHSIYFDGMEWYFAYRFFAYLGYLSSRPVACFILFYALHMFLNLYYTQRLCICHFGMGRRLAVIVAVSGSFTALGTAWFVNFFVIYSLVLPLTYFIISMIKDDRRIVCVLSSLVYVVAFNTGYITLSCILAASVFVFTFLWGKFYTELKFPQLVLKTVTPAIIGAVVCFLYLLKIYLLTKHVSAEGTTLFQALYLPVYIANLPSFCFFSYNAKPVEGGFVSLGLLWSFICILLFISKITKRMDKKNKVLFFGIIFVNLCILLASIGDVLPGEIWFYELPIFGSMHIRQRYFMVAMPYLYLALGLGAMHLDKQKDRKNMYVSLGVFCLSVAAIIYFAHGSFYQDALICELVMSGIGIYFMFREWFYSNQFVIVMVMEMICFTTNSFYYGMDITVTANDIKGRSAAYDRDANDRLAQYIAGLGNKEIYKYIGIESDNEVPMYVMNTFGWYHSQAAVLSNYLMYPLHGSAFSREYGTEAKVSFFNSFDWNYLFDTRADFAILDQGVIDTDASLYNEKVIDPGLDFLYLSGGHACVKVKKYIPRHYTGSEERILDTQPSLDNGYFYCPTLTNDSIVDFSTDNASEFNIVLKATSDAEVQFSMYAVDGYQFYLDGEKYTPQKDYGLAYFKIPKGEHEIRVIYKNIHERLIRYIYYGYYALWVFGMLLFIKKHMDIRSMKSRRKVQIMGEKND